MLKLANAGTIDQLKKIIAEFYYTTADKIAIANSGTVCNNGRELSTRVIKQRNKYIFYK